MSIVSPGSRLNAKIFGLCRMNLELSLEAGPINFCSFKALRVNGIWALMNMAFQADQKVKLTILSSLGTEQLFHLLSDENPEVVMKTLGMLRNLLTGEEEG